MKMKKRLLTCVAGLALLASCSLNIETGVDETRKGSDAAAVGFSVYVNRGVTTKAGWEGDLTTESLQADASGGFGVLAYYGTGVRYNETSKPDFMYNQQVKYDAGNHVWSYAPLKYWPNEQGSLLTFFAYAPFVPVAPETGLVTDAGQADAGILGLSRRTASGDPLVLYGTDFTPGQGVDLCWGVASDGHPFIDQVKPGANEPVPFEFQHALAQVNVTIDTDIDPEYTDAGLAKGTRVYVRSVTFTGFAAHGALDLNSQKGNPVWFDIAGTGPLRRDPVTIYDGRGDGFEGMAVGANPNEIPAALNRNIVQLLPYSATALSPGVSKTAVNLFENSHADASILVIPVNSAPLTVNIVYDVETIDPRVGGLLSDGVTHGVSIENNITKTVQFTGGVTALSAGRKYVIGLHLGLNSISFDATMADWDHTDYPPVDVPINTQQIASVSLSENSATKWIGETVTTPQVTVRATDGTTLTEGVKISWSSSDETVAKVDPETGAITVEGTGMTYIRATAEYDGSTGHANFTLYINKVTGMTLSTHQINTTPKVAQYMTVTVSHTSNGTVSMPDDLNPYIDENFVAFYLNEKTTSSDQTETTYAYFVMPDGVSTGRDMAVFTLGYPYTGSASSSYVYITVAAPTTPSTNSFRGYEVSNGFLKWDSNQNKYVISTVIDGEKEDFYFTWSALKGATLPDGWRVPTVADWSAIIKGLCDVNAPIIMNGTVKVHGYCKVEYAILGGVHFLLLAPDGIAITTTNSDFVSYFGSDNDAYEFDKVQLSETEFNHLLELGCIFLPCSGYYDGNNPVTGEMYYMAQSDGDNKKCLYVPSSGEAINYPSNDYYVPVVLVKKINP